MLKNTMDPETIRSKLSEWLSGALDGNPHVRITDVTVPESSGMSCETVLLDAIVDGAGGERTHNYVARVAPSGDGIFPVYDLEGEGRIMGALARGTDLPVPAMVAYEADPAVLGSPFLLVERHYGRIPADDPPFSIDGWVTELTDDQRATMFDSAVGTLAGIATADWRGLGLAGAIERSGDGSPLEREIAYWGDFYRQAAAGHSYPTLEATLEWVQQNRPAESGEISLSWGDSRFGNLMFGEDCRVSGVLDWEMATAGPPELDFGFFLFTNRMYSAGLGVPLPGGFSDHRRASARYQELSGREVRDIDFYEAFAGFRGATLVMRVGRLMIDMGMMPADAPMPSTNPASLTLASILDVPAPDGPGGWISGHR